ncbi:unnamed protein product [Mytilus edulis]|uniref:Tyr recombinase domain-containing protein n=1 Tax=Mytilus edulis TaxID=6550 RepID=A0A8S3TDB2_MYTED|nr:unnamed protein product [Mytilus edulis]
MGNRILKIIPLIENTRSALCPLRAYRNMCKLIPAAGDRPVFLFPSKHKLVPVTYTDFQQYIKAFISRIGRNPRLFSTHSFRRGGATFAFESKVPAELIQVHGDWAKTNTPLVSSLSSLPLVFAVIGWTLAVVLAGTTVFYKRQLHSQQSNTPVTSNANIIELSGANDRSDYINTDSTKDTDGHYESIK